MLKKREKDVKKEEKILKKRGKYFIQPMIL